MDSLISLLLILRQKHLFLKYFLYFVVIYYIY